MPVVTRGSGGNGNGSTAITVEWKPFGVSLAFTPTVLADGVINLVVEPEVSAIDPSASIMINNLMIPGLQTRRAKTVVEIRDGESFAMAGLIRKDFQDTIRQVPLLGSLPIIGALFRSTGFQHQDSELVMIVTPHLVRPVPEGALKVPTDRVGPPNEADLLLNGRTDTGVPPAARPFVTPSPVPPPPPPPVPPPAWRNGAGEETHRIRKGLWPCPLSALWNVVIASAALAGCSTWNSHYRRRGSGPWRSGRSTMLRSRPSILRQFMLRIRRSREAVATSEPQRSSGTAPGSDTAAACRDNEWWIIWQRLLG